MEQKIIQSADFPSLAYTVRGTGNPIILLHGFPFDQTIYNEVAEKLAAYHKVITIDIPGFGNSAPCTANSDFSSLCSFINLVADAENISSFVLAGHSMGGYIALAYATQFRHRLKGLSLVHSVASADNDEKKENRKKIIELLNKGGKQGYIRESVQQTFSEKFVLQHKPIVENRIALAAQTEVDVLIQSLQAMINREELVASLASWNLPLQWIAGKYDQLMTVEKIMSQATEANLNSVSIMQQSGHMSMLEQAPELSAELNEFVTFCFQSEG